MNGEASWEGECGDSALDGQLIGSSWWWGWLEQFIQVGYLMFFFHLVAIIQSY